MIINKNNKKRDLINKSNLFPRVHHWFSKGSGIELNKVFLAGPG